MILEVSMDMLVTNKMGKMIDTVNAYTVGSDNALFLNTIITTGLVMMYSETGMLDKKMMMKKGRKIAKKMGIM